MTETNRCANCRRLIPDDQRFCETCRSCLKLAIVNKEIDN